MKEIEGKIIKRFEDKITTKTDDNQEYLFQLFSLLTPSDIIQYFNSGKRIKIIGNISETNNEITEIKEIWLKIF